MKKILAVTGIRSEYDILYPIIKKIQSSECFELGIVVTGAHLSDWHGNTISKIEDDGFKIVEKIDCLLMTNRSTQRSKGVGLLIESLTQTVERENPDILLVVGDREESIATCIVGNYMNVLVAHLGGGDPVYGNSDDPIRFACSKLAHIHFTTSQFYADNLIKIGEDKFRVCFTGNPAFSNIIETKSITRSELTAKLNFDITSTNYIVFLKHPLSSEVENSYDYMAAALNASIEFINANNMKLIGIYPNTDPGSYNILKAIDEVDSNNVKFFKTLPRDIFVNIMRNAMCLAGNSSMGILEAPLYRLPVVNIGNRQKGRLNAGNVEFVEYDKLSIINSLKKACFDVEYRSAVSNLNNPFGNGKAPDKVLEFLMNVDISDKKWHTKTHLC
jgi:GDP/UDP-N,N'-diacetylbacillosamine 2-epimerase (hydrolysing)